VPSRRGPGIHRQNPPKDFFDANVNVGFSRAVRLYQQAINSMGGKMAVDGVLGPKTRQAQCNRSEQAILQAYVIQQKAFYISIVTRKPSQRKFLNGWLRRAEWLPTK
jgi:type VI secretion system secreted protein VgrG